MTDFGSRHKASHQDGGGDEISVAGLSGLLADEQDAGEIKGVEVDDTDKGDGKSLNYNETSEKLEYETPAVGGDTYVDRGDPSAWDWFETDLTLNGAWQDLDCSAIVPQGAKAIHLLASIKNTSAGHLLAWRKNGNSNSYNLSRQTTQVSSISIDLNAFVSCDTNRIIEYLATSSVAWEIDIIVRGWFI